MSRFKYIQNPSGGPEEVCLMPALNVCQPVFVFFSSTRLVDLGGGKRYWRWLKRTKIHILWVSERERWRRAEMCGYRSLRDEWGPLRFVFQDICCHTLIPVLSLVASRCDKSLVLMLPAHTNHLGWCIFGKADQISPLIGLESAVMIWLYFI